jgi:SAM-dependent methyltransferase
MNKEFIEKNREAWNEALLYHQKARKNWLYDGFKNNDFSTFNRTGDDILIENIKNINLKDKIIAQLPCNNGRELLSLMKFGAKKGIGFDISDTAIMEAEKLKNISNLNVEFNRIDILEIDDTYNNTIDFIYISEGSLLWFYSLNEYFKIISKLLKQDGIILVYEMHPFAYFFQPSNDLNEVPTLDNFLSYFEKGLLSNKSGLDYIGGEKYEAKECFSYMHKFSDIINSIVNNCIGIEKIEEYNFGCGMELMNGVNEDIVKKFPLSYILIGKKK